MINTDDLIARNMSFAEQGLNWATGPTVLVECGTCATPARRP